MDQIIIIIQFYCLKLSAGSSTPNRVVCPKFLFFNIWGRKRLLCGQIHTIWGENAEFGGCFRLKKFRVASHDLGKNHTIRGKLKLILGQKHLIWGTKTQDQKNYNWYKFFLLIFLLRISYYQHNWLGSRLRKLTCKLVHSVKNRKKQLNCLTSYLTCKLGLGFVSFRLVSLPRE